ncbi:hypothetical protein C0J52_10534 [Blattella germanica]|nr:hypothetical protein C0J52_10534 [Blattella germanica]
MTQLSSDLLAKSQQKSSHVLNTNKGKISSGFNSKFFYGSGSSRSRNHAPYVFCSRATRNGSTVSNETEEQSWGKLRFRFFRTLNHLVSGIWFEVINWFAAMVYSTKTGLVIFCLWMHGGLSSPPRKQRRMSLAQITPSPQECRAKRALTYSQLPETEVFTPPEDESNKENWDSDSVDLNKILESLDRNMKEEAPEEAKEQEERDENQEEVENKAKSTKTSPAPLPLPHDVGFPNPSGSNRCWMNATLQMLFGMEVFTQQLELSCWREDYATQSSVIRSFLDVIRHRRHVKRTFADCPNVDPRVYLFAALRRLALSFGSMVPTFVLDRQHDATEFMVRLLDLLRDMYVSSERCTLRELQLDNLPSSGAGAQRNDGDNPNEENFALYVDVPPTSEFRPSLQDALNRYMQPDVRELKCTRCNGQRSRVQTAFSKLPRFLIVQVKRYAVQTAIAEKLTDLLRVSLNLSVKDFVTADVTLPEPLHPLVQCEEDLTQYGAEDIDDPELQEAMRQSLNEDEEERELEMAIQLSLQETRISAMQDADISIGAGDLSTEIEDETHLELSYRLISIMMHQGISPNCGHYVADVYNIEHGKWFHYDDENVSNPKEEEVLGRTRQRNGYVFCYMYRPHFNELTQRHTTAQQSPW